MCEHHEWRKADKDPLSYRYYCPHCYSLGQLIDGVVVILGRM